MRVLSEAVLRLGGERLQPVQHWLDGPSGATFVSVAPGFTAMVHDPTAQVRRQRETTADGLREQIILTSYAEVPVATELTLDLAVDLARVHLVKGAADAKPVAGQRFWRCRPWSAAGRVAPS